jgi:leucyl aminopeptidase
LLLDANPHGLFSPRRAVKAWEPRVPALRLKDCDCGCLGAPFFFVVYYFYLPYEIYTMNNVAYHEAKNKIEIPIVLVTSDSYAKKLKQSSPCVKNWLETTEYSPKPGAYRFIPNEKGRVSEIVLCVDIKNSLWSLAPLMSVLPAGQYYCDVHFCIGLDLGLAALGFGLAGYRFDRYKAKKDEVPGVVSLRVENIEELQNMKESITLVRDLINIPCEDLGPLHLAEVAKNLADSHHAKCKIIQGDDLLKAGYPAVHMVGRASSRAPCFVEIEWGRKSHPSIALVGKGVCFDTGGLDLKDAASMLLMKKDMGGAAHVLGLARLIMRSKLPVHLHVLLPCVENSVSGSAFRPGDIMTTRSGQTVEVGNTDAEGRLILADALTRALELTPELIVDFATLTGAARVALGGDLPAFFCNNDKTSEGILYCAAEQQDPLWRMPLYQPYNDALKGKVADLSNTSSMKLGGAITAALFLQRFVDAAIPWVHIDCMAWNDGNRPGRPEGGEAMGLRAIFEYLKRSYR